MAFKESEIQILFDEIISKIEDGRAVRTILKEDRMPSSQTFYKWIDGDKEKSKRYARACELRADAIFEDILCIADDNSKDVYTVDIDGIEIEKVDHEAINRSRLKVDARKWMVSKLNPKKYGDSSLLKLGNNEGDELKINAIFSQDLLSVPSNNSVKADS